MTKRDNTGLSRRDFLKLSKNAAIGAGVAGVLPNWIWVREGLTAVPASQGYLLVDTKKCQGCITCMLSCSLVHEGVANPSLSRIQILQNPYESFPDDVMIAQCRQCVDPACVNACADKAGVLQADADNGNVRRVVDREGCWGCGACARACPFTPTRPVVTSDENSGGSRKSRKCDLCTDTPYHWDAGGGGPGGKQTCISVCPVSAISYTETIPEQSDAGYSANLRTASWARLGYPTD